MKIIKTDHAIARLQQRGVNDRIVSLIDQYGKVNYDNHGGIRMMIPRNRITQLMRENPTLKSLLEKAKGIYLVLSAHDMTLVTVGHSYK